MLKLSALDAGFLALETDDAPLHVGALLLMDSPAPDPDVVRAELVRRASATQACRRRVVRTSAWRRPVWTYDVSTGLGSHVHVTSVRAPHDLDALRARAGELMSARLDTSRPLWEAWIVVGLADGTWAVLVKAHHTLLDGVAGAGLLASLLAPAVPDQVRGEPVAVGQPRRQLRERAGLVRQGIRTVAVPDLPTTVLNGPLGDRRTWAWCSVELADLHRVAEGAGCTINDVYLAALAGGLRAGLGATGALDAGSRVRVLVPVSTRLGADALPGNMDAAFFIDLPVHLASPRDVLDDVARQTARAKADGVPLATEQLLRAGDLVPVPLLDRAARAYVRRGQARVNLVASDVAGPPLSLELCGSPVRAIVPCLPLALDVRVTSALLSYAGRATISMTVDAAVGPDASVLVAAVETALAALVTATEARPDGPGRAAAG